jgi:hypothetical protein
LQFIGDCDPLNRFCDPDWRDFCVYHSSIGWLDLHQHHDFDLAPVNQPPFAIAFLPDVAITLPNYSSFLGANGGVVPGRSAHRQRRIYELSEIAEPGLFPNVREASATTALALEDSLLFLFPFQLLPTNADLSLSCPLRG